jgi:glucosamine--fructose-6-phosphate aminotransferase (isomerizing)
VVGVLTDGDNELGGQADEAIFMPETPAHLVPIAATVPLQMLAYEIGLLRGADIDQPRNLAKSVTVE